MLKIKVTIVFLISYIFVIILMYSDVSDIFNYLSVWYKIDE